MKIFSFTIVASIGASMMSSAALLPKLPRARADCPSYTPNRPPLIKPVVFDLQGEIITYKIMRAFL